ncbi:MAG: aspartate carbamoyltransferase [Acidobacteriales bacterium]|nr:aspartate carbamoyltransferase [Terriglobales bacterium]
MERTLASKPQAGLTQGRSAGNGGQLRHVVESQQFTVPLLMELFQRARGMERVVARGGTSEFNQRIMATLFYEPSTRTRFSFEAAMYRLGGQVLSTEHARSFSSEIQAEQVEDSIRIIGSYSDVIVIRHHQEGGARRAAQVSPVPLINAGDGEGGQHPTQALLDLYTIYRERPLDGLSVAMIGELDKGRTARSLAYLLAKFERIRIYFVSPPEMQMRSDILAYLDEHSVRYEVEEDVEKVVASADVVYQTRIHPDRVRDPRRLRQYSIGADLLQRMKPDAMILHPLPRTVELDAMVDKDPRAMYFKQAVNGLYVRMALLTMLLEEQ